MGSSHKFAYELTHDFDGPIEGIVKTLQRHANLDDVVAINYGDLPVKFYTDTAFENREDPRLHRFRTAQDVPGVRIFRKLR